MSSIVTSILSSTVGLLWNKARDSTADKLKDGGITDAKIREIVVRELNDIKTKLDGLSRKDILSSYCFLKEGVELLKVCLDESKFEHKAATLSTADDHGEASSGMSSDVQTTEILNEAVQLPHAMGKTKIYSDNKDFQSAKKRFKDARKKATEAFCNEALRIQDRIFVAKVRVVSEILECLADPQTAVTGCLSFLKDLHGLPAVREIFSVYLNGGVKSLMNKAERVESVKSIMMINYVMFNLISKFSHNLLHRLTWPEIELTGHSFNPITDWLKISTRKSMGEDLPSQPPSKLIFDEAILPYLSVIRRGDVVVVNKDKTTINVVSEAGERWVVKLPDFQKPKSGYVLNESTETGERKMSGRRLVNGDSKVLRSGIAGLAVDNNNNIYLVRWFQIMVVAGLDLIQKVNFTLNVLVQNDIIAVKQVCKLDFLGEDYFWSVRMTINGNNNIIIISSTNLHVCICDITGVLKNKFGFPYGPSMLSISHKNEIMISSKALGALHFYSEEGDLKSTINLPHGHVAYGAAFHYVLCKIIVLTNVVGKDSCFLLCYSETGELETSTFFCEKNENESPTITSHPGGPVAVARSKSITYI